jgi:hypothetical protein
MLRYVGAERPWQFAREPVWERMCQGVDERGAAPVLIVLVPDSQFVGAPAQATVYMTGSGEAAIPVIALRESTATAQELSTTYAALNAWRRLDSETLLATAGPLQLGRRAHKAPYKWAEAVLRNLQVAPAREILGIGRFRTTVFQP